MGAERMQPTATSHGRNVPSERTQPPSSMRSSVPILVSSMPRWLAMNQMSETEMVCPSCLILLGQHSGVTAPVDL